MTLARGDPSLKGVMCTTNTRNHPDPMVLANVVVCQGSLRALQQHNMGSLKSLRSWCDEPLVYFAMKRDWICSFACLLFEGCSFTSIPDGESEASLFFMDPH